MTKGNKKGHAGLIIFILILILAIGGGTGFYFYQRQQPRKALEEEPEESSLSILLRELFISSSTLLKFADMIFTVSSSRETIFHPESVLITG